MLKKLMIIAALVASPAVAGPKPLGEILKKVPQESYKSAAPVDEIVTCLAENLDHVKASMTRSGEGASKVDKVGDTTHFSVQPDFGFVTGQHRSWLFTISLTPEGAQTKVEIRAWGAAYHTFRKKAEACTKPIPLA